MKDGMSEIESKTKSLLKKIENGNESFPSLDFKNPENLSGFSEKGYPKIIDGYVDCEPHEVIVHLVRNYKHKDNKHKVRACKIDGKPALGWEEGIFKKPVAWIAGDGMTYKEVIRLLANDYGEHFMIKG